MGGSQLLWSGDEANGDVPGRRRLGGPFVRTPGEVLDTERLLGHRPWPSAGPECPSGRPQWPLAPSLRPEGRRLYLADEPRLLWMHAFARGFMMARPRYALSDRRSRRLRGLL